MTKDESSMWQRQGGRTTPFHPIFRTQRDERNYSLTKFIRTTMREHADKDEQLLDFVNYLKRRNVTYGHPFALL